MTLTTEGVSHLAQRIKTDANKEPLQCLAE
jgi:hypothetical protein